MNKNQLKPKPKKLNNQKNFINSKNIKRLPYYTKNQKIDYYMLHRDFPFLHFAAENG